jgi:hypothetical protein
VSNANDISLFPALTYGSVDMSAAENCHSRRGCT